MRKTTKIVGQCLPRPGLMKLADVVAIPTRYGFAYARQHMSGALGVFDIDPTRSLLTLEETKKLNRGSVLFVEYSEPMDRPNWVYLGNWKFDSEREAESPPVYIEDSISPGVFRILENGGMRTASREEVEGLELHVLLDPDAVQRKIEKYFEGKVTELEERPMKEACPSDGRGITTFAPLILEGVSDDRGADFRLIFGDWEWLSEKVGDAYYGYDFNGTGVEALIKAARIEAGLSIDGRGIEYNSEGDTCFIKFSDWEEARITAKLAQEVLLSENSLRTMIARVRAEGLEE